MRAFEVSKNRTTRTVSGSTNDLTGDEVYINQELVGKRLDPTIFLLLSSKWRCIGIEADGCAFAYDIEVESFGNQFIHTLTNDTAGSLFLGKGFDTKDWEDSLINRGGK